jgi:hypothetical protein
MGMKEDNEWREQESKLAQQAREHLARVGPEAIAGTLFRCTQGTLTAADDVTIVRALERVCRAEAQAAADEKARLALAASLDEAPTIPETDSGFNEALAERNAELQRAGIAQREENERLKADLAALRASLKLPAE